MKVPEIHICSLVLLWAQRAIFEPHQSMRESSQLVQYLRSQDYFGSILAASWLTQPPRTLLESSFLNEYSWIGENILGYLENLLTKNYLEEVFKTSQ